MKRMGRNSGWMRLINASPAEAFLAADPFQIGDKIVDLGRIELKRGHFLHAAMAHLNALGKGFSQSLDVIFGR